MPQQLSKELRALIFAMRQGGASIDETMGQLGVSEYAVEHFGGKVGPRRRGRPVSPNHHDFYKPQCFVALCDHEPVNGSKFCKRHSAPAIRSREPLARLMAGR